MLNKCCHDEFVPKLDIIPTWQGQLRIFFWLTRLANAMYCTVFLSDDPKVRCGGFNWVNNQCRDLDCIIWPEHIWSISKGIATSLSRWPGAMCIIFLQMQVRGDAPSMFNLTQQARTHMNEWMNVSTTGLTKMSWKKWRCRWSSSSQRIEAVEFLRPIHQAPLIGLRSWNKQAGGGDVAVTAFADLSFDLPLKPLRELGIHGHAFVSAGNLAKLTKHGFGKFSLTDFLQTFRSSAGFGVVVPTRLFRIEVHPVALFKISGEFSGEVGA
jgi:hypothetical protein